MKELIKKLVTIQSSLKAPKSQENTFGKYKYRKAEDILEAVKPLLKDEGLLISMSDSVVLIGDRFYVKSIASITDGEHTHSVEALAREEETKKGMDGSQITGASSSYARKYALNGLFAIDDTADSDHTNDGQQEQKRSNTGASQQTQQATKPAKQESAAQVELKPGSKLWGTVIKWVKDEGITEDKWPEIKDKYYKMTDEDESTFKKEAGFLPF